MKTIEVTAGIIRDGDKILIAQRIESGSCGLLWEFPGGKIEEGEDSKACLARELNEELNISVKVGDLFLENEHEYPDKTIKLITFIVDSFEGEMKVNVHEIIKWITLDEIDEYEFAPADIPVVDKLKAQ